MNIFDQYGIREVADVTLYSIHKKKDGSGEVYYVPALYLDTLKISSVEKSADNVWAEGGLGNARLISWDYGKQINVTLEDALCTPASLGLCWNGVLGADWKDGSVDINTDVCYCKNPVNKISRMEKAIFPRDNKEKCTVSELLPKLDEDIVDRNLDLLMKSSVVDGTKITGNGIVNNHTYRWKMAVESEVKSIAQVPDRFFDVKGRSYPIDWNRKVSVTSLPTYENYKDAIIYKINSCDTKTPPKAKIIFDDAMETQIDNLYLNLKAVYGNYVEKRNVKYYLPVQSGASDTSHPYILIKDAYVLNKDNKTYLLMEERIFNLLTAYMTQLGKAAVGGNVSTEEYPIYVEDNGVSSILEGSTNIDFNAAALDLQKDSLPFSHLLIFYEFIEERDFTPYTDSEERREKFYYRISKNVSDETYRNSSDRQDIDRAVSYLKTVYGSENVVEKNYKVKVLASAQKGKKIVYGEDEFTFKNLITINLTSGGAPLIYINHSLISQLKDLAMLITQYTVHIGDPISNNYEVLGSLHVNKKTALLENRLGELCYFQLNPVEENSFYFTPVIGSDYEDALPVRGNYKQNRATTSLFDTTLDRYIADISGSVEITYLDKKPIDNAQYLAIIVDNSDNYYALVGYTDLVNEPYYNKEYDDNYNPIVWYRPEVDINVTQFKGLDMWLRFSSINEMVYFLITKYENDIIDIIPTYINPNFGDTRYGYESGWAVNNKETVATKDNSTEAKNKQGKLWAYVNPRTMQPYNDDYWFHQGEPIYIKSLTIAPKDKKIKANRITVKADQWPGMYMMVGETYIRSRDTGEDERMQIKFPLCKVKSDHTLTLEAGGDPTTFKLDLEVARPASGTMMEITSYEVAQKLYEGDNGCFYAVDGTTEVLSE